MYAMTIAASALGARLESHSFQPGFLLSFIFFTSFSLRIHRSLVDCTTSISHLTTFIKSWFVDFSNKTS